MSWVRNWLKLSVSRSPRMAVADVDIRTLASERLRQGSFDDNRIEQQAAASDYRTISVH